MMTFLALSAKAGRPVASYHDYAEALLGKTVNYSVLKKGTVVLTGQNDTSGSNHINTWRIAYAIPGIRDWIIKQTKAS